MKYPLLSLLCALSLTACAQSASVDGKTAEAAASGSAARPDPAAEKRVRDALKRVAPKAVIDRVAPAEIAGFQEVITSGRTVYVSNDGRYFLEGGLYDVENERDVSQLGLSVVRREVLSKVPASDRIVFAPATPAKYRVSVFTDIECGYCRKLHSEIAEYNRLGISIEYLAFPRAGLDSPDALAMESVWCSDDRRKALTDAKNGATVAPRRCDNPVAEQYQIGQRLGLTGTPMIVNSDGVMLPGYLPPDKMLEALDKLAAASGKKAGSEAAKTASADVAKVDSAAGAH